jgi:hypothetical protein
VSVEALHFVWALAMVGWGASALVGCEDWTSGTLADVPICCCKIGVSMIFNKLNMELKEYL